MNDSRGKVTAALYTGPFAWPEHPMMINIISILDKRHANDMMLRLI
ncbi:hypothetical protein C900_02171 [Fulvivirga imtechensis AK7]|uniref:Uncharacterized protein n=1 Tax=Fulvivirga imtechensis AK7 TaxID=1237149 RepID=L8JXH9_9BACT|nr:hypothetical protein [Fulvivirga imtechensis]ELR71932.1 hypothetical protein C900_02171 [Fulvivirga imtechensis AK7]